MTGATGIGYVGYYPGRTSTNTQAWYFHIWKAQHMWHMGERTVKARTLCGQATSHTAPSALFATARGAADEIGGLITGRQKPCPHCTPLATTKEKS